MMKPRRPLTTAEALARASALCSKCEQCSSDLLRKFAAWGLTSAQSREVMDTLISRRWVDDARYARAFASDKVRFGGWGRAKIEAALRAKRIDSADIDSAFDEIDPELYRDTALRVMRSKVRVSGADLADYDTRLKLLRFGMGRGFEYQLTADVIRQLRVEADNQSDTDEE